MSYNNGLLKIYDDDFNGIPNKIIKEFGKTEGINSLCKSLPLHKTRNFSFGDKNEQRFSKDDFLWNKFDKDLLEDLTNISCFFDMSD